MIINGIKWRIRFVPFLYSSSGNRALGCCDKRDKIIYVDSTLNKIEMRIVLTHEITHAVICSYDIEMNDQEEEIVARFISYYGEEIVGLTKGVI